MTELGYRRATTLAVAHSRRLPEIVAVNSFFTALTAHARHHPGTELARWLAQRRCHDSVLEFFLHYAGEEPMSQLIAALVGYDALDQATPQLATNVLLWLTSTQRETELHRTVPSRPYLLATATHSPAATPPTPSGSPSAAAGPGNA